MKWWWIVAFVVPAKGWGDKTHKVIAHMAGELLNTQGRRFVASVLDVDLEQVSAAMAQVSVWADSEGREQVARSVSWHFVNFVDANAKSYKRSRDCGESGSDCVVGALAKNVFEAAKNGGQIPLKFIIHLVADMHQPLHLGFEEDRGGNSLRVVRPDDMPDLSKDASNLHKLWDHSVPSWAWRKPMGPDFTVDPRSPHWERYPEFNYVEIAHGYLANAQRNNSQWIIPKLSKGIFETESLLHLVFAQVATDILNQYTRPLAYVNVDEAGLSSRFTSDRQPVSREYLNMRSQLIPELVSKAAVRLAQIINLVASVNSDINDPGSPWARRMARLAGKPIYNTN